MPNGKINKKKGYIMSINSKIVEVIYSIRQKYRGGYTNYFWFHTGKSILKNLERMCGLDVIVHLYIPMSK